MKKFFYLMLLALMPMCFTDCSNENDSIDPFVGTWQYSDEYISLKITIKDDGSGYWEKKYINRISSGKILIKATDNKIWIAFLNDRNEEDGLFYVVIKGNKMYLYEDDIPDEPEAIFTKINDAGDDEIKDKLIGTWSLSFGEDGLSKCLLTFKQDGTVRYQEYDHGEWEEDATYNYTYIDGVVYLSYLDGRKRETFEVISVSKTELVLKDWPDLGVNTFVKQ